MEIKNFGFADSPILESLIEIEPKKISLLFDFAYDLNSKKYLSNIKLVISLWKEFESFKYISSDNFISYDKINIDIDNLENFRLIQITNLLENELVLEGYSKESSCWIVYKFYSPTIKLLQMS
jgi:hypothetical protein